ncbi:MAG: hypothetical protein DRG33_00135 [Deltaproteobacteria bacterium]|nr:MAG: hypothetical protein DRG33_00135 [Deltaproteobacteria bacterium]
MTEQQTTQDKWKEFEAKLRKTEEKKALEFFKELATREKLERDFKEDVLYITFETSPETKRTVMTRRPTHSEMFELIRLVLSVSRFTGENPSDEDIKAFQEAYERLPKIAASLCIKPKLDEKFWSEVATWTALQNFINEVITAAQAPRISDKELESFRK